MKLDIFKKRKRFLKDSLFSASFERVIKKHLVKVQRGLPQAQISSFQLDRFFVKKRKIKR
jgi:hypothetical protein